MVTCWPFHKACNSPFPSAVPLVQSLILGQSGGRLATPSNRTAAAASFLNEDVDSGCCDAQHFSWHCAKSSKFSTLCSFIFDFFLFFQVSCTSAIIWISPACGLHHCMSTHIGVSMWPVKGMCGSKGSARWQSGLYEGCLTFPSTSPPLLPKLAITQSVKSSSTPLEVTSSSTLSSQTRCSVGLLCCPQWTLIHYILFHCQMNSNQESFWS